MQARILDGKRIAEAIRGETAQRVADWRARGGTIPCLAAVLVGDNPASAVYVRNKQRACEAVGIKSRLLKLSDSDGQDKLLETVDALNSDPEVHGILVQLPLPKGYQETLVLDRVHPLKDVDAFCPENVGLLSQGRPRFIPCTPHGVIQLLAREGLTVAGKQAIVIGRSDIVGKPLAMLLAGREGPCGQDYANGTVIFAHSRTVGLEELTRSADLVFAAVGRAEMVRPSWLKPGAIVIDIGINRVGDRLVGDVDFEGCRQVASAITPVPGGIGPLTIAMLLENTLQAARGLASSIGTK